jgi:hypothetical protein
MGKTEIANKQKSRRRILARKSPRSNRTAKPSRGTIQIFLIIPKLLEPHLRHEIRKLVSVFKLGWSAHDSEFSFEGRVKHGLKKGFSASPRCARGATTGVRGAGGSKVRRGVRRVLEAFKRLRSVPAVRGCRDAPPGQTCLPRQRCARAVGPLFRFATRGTRCAPGGIGCRVPAPF